jgi:serine/threonine protein phosphatase PrpC
VCAGDQFVLCSDGLWAYFDEAELGALVHANPARQACEILIELARERADGQGDNVSLVVIKLQAAAGKPAARP